MATLYEYYNTGDDDSKALYGAHWDAQTFTPSTAHTITAVKLLVRRAGLPGTVTVSIRATTSFRPTGADLCSGTTNGDTLTTDSAGEWRTITFTTSYALSATVLYAIVVRATGGDINNNLRWRADSTSPGYTDGYWTSSANSGVSWTNYTGTDFMFEEWGGFPTGGILAVKTEACTDIAPESLTGNGVVTDLGSSTVTQHGHCWSTSQNPTTAVDTKTTLGTAYQTGHFTSAITPLVPGTTYYIKAYATNTEGTAYGSQVSNTMATAIGRRHIWLDKEYFHYYDKSGLQRKVKGTGVASGDSDIPWPF